MLMFASYSIADVQALRESEEKCRQQVADVTRRESMLLKSLTEKEREISDLAVSVISYSWNCLVYDYVES